MYSVDIASWLKTATGKIRFRQDRIAVQDELRQHMEEKWEDLREQGIPEKEIDQRILKDMGSAEELAPLLAEIHKPHLGYTLTVLKWITALLIVASLIAVGNAGGGSMFQSDSEWLNDTTKGDFQRVFYDEPAQSFRCEDYILQIQKVALWTTTSTQYYYESAIYLQIRVMKPPLAPRFNAWQYLGAQDSNGSIYYPFNDRGWAGGFNNVSLKGVKYGVFSDTQILVIRNLDGTPMEWIDLYYDRDGRNATVRIQLTGGDST